MIGCIMFILLCIALSVVSWKWHVDAGNTAYGTSLDTGWGTMAFLFIILAVFLAIYAISQPFVVAMDIGKFQSQKAYIENHVSRNSLEDIALTEKKIEMNEWLFRSQQSQEHFRIFSFFPTSIQNLEPIQ